MKQQYQTQHIADQKHQSRVMSQEEQRNYQRNEPEVMSSEENKERGSSQSFFKRFSPLKMVIGSPNKGANQKKAPAAVQQLQLLTSPPAESQLLQVNNASPFSNITNQVGIASPVIKHYEPIQSESPAKKQVKLETPQKKLYDSENKDPAQNAPITSQNPLESSLMKSSPIKRALMQHQQVLQTSTEVKVNVLEYENQQLKTQIEMLRSALMKLCNNPTTSEPIPFFAQQHLQMMQINATAPKLVKPVEEPKVIQKTHSRSPLKRPENKASLAKSNESKVTVPAQVMRSPHRRLPSNLTQDTQSAVCYGNQQSTSSFTAIRRRRRSQRQNSVSGETPQNRKQVAGAQISGEADVTSAQREKTVVPFDYNGQFYDKKQYQQLQSEFCADTECRSRIDDACDKVINQIISTKPHSLLVSQQQTPVRKNGQPLQIKNQPESNLVSHDTKFYENVISNLRSELEQFEQEEQKIISLLGVPASQNNSNPLHSKSIDQALPKVVTQNFYNEMLKNGTISSTAQNSGFNHFKNGGSMINYEQHPKPISVMARSFTPCQELMHTNVLNNHRQSAQELSATDFADNDDHRLFEEIDGVILEEERDDEDSIVVQQKEGSVEEKLQKSPTTQEKRLQNLQEVFQFIQSQKENPIFGFREESKSLIRPIKITSPMVTAVEERASKMFANIKIGKFADDIQPLNTNKTTAQHSPIAPMHQGIFLASPVSLGEDSTPQCSALLKNPGVQTSPSPDTRNKAIKQLPSTHQGLSLKSNSWMAASQKLNGKDGGVLGDERQMLNYRNHNLPNLSHQPSNISDNTNYQDPTPKVIPYNPDFLADSATTNNQLRVKSPVKQPVNSKPFTHHEDIQTPSQVQILPSDDDQVIDLIIPTDGNRSRAEFISKLTMNRNNSQLSSGQNSERKISRKMDRSESIKRAEEMLTQFMREHKDGQGQLKRPEFMRNKVRGGGATSHVKMLSESNGILNGILAGKTLDSNNKNSLSFSFSPLIGKEIKTERERTAVQHEKVVEERSQEEELHEDKVYMMQEAINNISFQMPTVQQQQRELLSLSPQPPVPEIPVFQQSAKPQIPRISYHDIQMYDGDLINLEINPVNSSAQPNYPETINQSKFTYEIQTQNFKSFDDFRVSGTYSPSKKIVPFNNNNNSEYHDEDNFLQPQIIKMSANPTPASCHNGMGAVAQHMQAMTNAFDITSSFDHISKSPQTPSVSSQSAQPQRKKLSTQHKLKKASTGSGSTDRIASQNRENSASSASKIQKSGPRKVPSKSPSRGAGSSFIQKQPSQLEINGASLVSNAIFLAKQLQSLQQPFIQQKETVVTVKKPKTAESYKLKTIPKIQIQQESGGNSSRQSLAPTTYNQHSSFLNHNMEETRNYIQASNTTLSKTIQKPSSSIARSVHTAQKRNTQKSRSNTRSANNQSALNSNRGDHSMQQDMYSVQVPDFTTQDQRGPNTKIRPLRVKNHLTDLSVCSGSSGHKPKSSGYGRIQKRTTRESMNPEMMIDLTQKSSKSTYQSNSSLAKPQVVKSAISQFKGGASKVSKKPMIETENLDSFIIPTHESLTPTVSAYGKTAKPLNTNSAVKRITTTASAQRMKKAEAAQSFINASSGNEYCGDNLGARQLFGFKNYQVKSGSMIHSKPSQVIQPSMDRSIRPGQQQVREYYQLKREHERLRKIIQQQSSNAQQLELNSSGKFQMGSFNGSFIKKQHLINQQQQQPQFDVRETAHFEHGFNGQTSEIKHFQQSNQPNSNQCCDNCESLRARGLSTKFCLDHSGLDNQLLNISGIQPGDYSPMKGGQLQQQMNEDLGCSIIYIDE